MATAESFVAEHPELVPTMKAIVAIAKHREETGGDGIGEFSRDWVAAQEPTTPRTLQAFVKAGLIKLSPLTGKRRNFYVLAEPESFARACG